MLVQISPHLKAEAEITSISKGKGCSVHCCRFIFVAFKKETKWRKVYVHRIFFSLPAASDLPPLASVVSNGKNNMKTARRKERIIRRFKRRRIGYRNLGCPAFMLQLASIIQMLHLHTSKLINRCSIRFRMFFRSLKACKRVASCPCTYRRADGVESA